MRRYLIGVLIGIACAWRFSPQTETMLVGGQQTHQAASRAEPTDVAIADAGTPGGVCLTVRVKDLVPRGDLMIALFDESGTFPSRDKAVITQSLPVTKQQASVRFKSLLPGNYAVAVFQDLNGDGKLNKTGFGAPMEPYGFSNDARSNFGPPSFKAAAFRIAKEGKQMDVVLR